jgi:hypothetical protein
MAHNVITARSTLAAATRCSWCRPRLPAKDRFLENRKSEAARALRAPEGVEHNVVNANAYPSSFIEVEHLKDGSDAERKATLDRFVGAWNAHDLDGIMLQWPTTAFSDLPPVPIRRAASSKAGRRWPKPLPSSGASPTRRGPKAGSPSLLPAPCGNERSLERPRMGRCCACSVSTPGRPHDQSSRLVGRLPVCVVHAPLVCGRRRSNGSERAGSARRVGVLRWIEGVVASSLFPSSRQRCGY